jgi:hypothetical protein
MIDSPDSSEDWDAQRHVPPSNRVLFHARGFLCVRVILSREDGEGPHARSEITQAKRDHARPMRSWPAKPGLG